jgi:hypothetical protein
VLSDHHGWWKCRDLYGTDLAMAQRVENRLNQRFAINFSSVLKLYFAELIVTF